MFKWPKVPPPSAGDHELADFAEMLCWRDGNTSKVALLHSIERLAENEYEDGVPEEEALSQRVQDAYQEIELRKEGCGEGYPFCLGKEGNTLYHRPKKDNPKHEVYKYLLLATRINMASNRRHADIDGAHLFEELSAQTCKEYFGDSSRSMVFGTAAGGAGFKEKVNSLCAKIMEGNGFKSKSDKSVREKDGKLDVVTWIHFSDGLPGKFIAFGQCKTGTHYLDDLPILQPDSFCRKWMNSMPALVPMRMFFIAEALPRGNFYDLASDAGLLFDRCRIVDNSGQVSETLLGKVESWTLAAANSTGLHRH